MAPFVSVAFSTGLTADCTALSLTPAGGLVQVRPAFGGNVMAQIVTPSARPQMATVRYGVFEPVQPCRNGTPPKVVACWKTFPWMRGGTSPPPGYWWLSATA